MQVSKHISNMDYVYFTNAGNKCGRKRTLNFPKGHTSKHRQVGVDLRCPIYCLEEKNPNNNNKIEVGLQPFVVFTTPGH